MCVYTYIIVDIGMVSSLTEKQYGKAREHFLYAEQPQEFGLMLVEVATTFGYTGEADLFITQVVLQ